MKFLTKFLILLALLQAFPGAAKPAQLSRLTVMSYNIRQGSANDGTNSWEFRYPATAMMIEDQKPDVFGIQEAMSYQILFIEDTCRDYRHVGVGSPRPRTSLPRVGMRLAAAPRHGPF